MAPVAAVTEANSWFPNGNLTHFCKDGITNFEEDVCCMPECETCGGGQKDGDVACAERPGGAEHCCAADIEATGNICATASDVICMMPLTCRDDRCLLHCPLDPACSIVWKERGYDYMELRSRRQREKKVPDQAIA